MNLLVMNRTVSAGKKNHNEPCWSCQSSGLIFPPCKGKGAAGAATAQAIKPPHLITHLPAPEPSKAKPKLLAKSSLVPLALTFFLFQGSCFGNAVLMPGEGISGQSHGWEGEESAGLEREVVLEPFEVLMTIMEMGVKGGGEAESWLGKATEVESEISGTGE